MALEKNTNAAEQLNTQAELVKADQVWPKEAYDASVPEGGEKKPGGGNVDSKEAEAVSPNYSGLKDSINVMNRSLNSFGEWLKAPNVPLTAEQKKGQYAKERLTQFNLHVFPSLRDMVPGVELGKPVVVQPVRFDKEKWVIHIAYTTAARETVIVEISPSWSWTYTIDKPADLEGKNGSVEQGSF